MYVKSQNRLRMPTEIDPNSVSPGLLFHFRGQCFILRGGARKARSQCGRDSVIRLFIFSFRACLSFAIFCTIIRGWAAADFRFKVLFFCCLMRRFYYYYFSLTRQFRVLSAPNWQNIICESYAF